LQFHGNRSGLVAVLVRTALFHKSREGFIS
jgi:hypothetical protein